MVSAMDLSWVMVLLAGLSVVAVAVVAKFLPETKHLSVDEVVAVFEEQRTGPQTSPSVRVS